jgi:hypothetical protein
VTFLDDIVDYDAATREFLDVVTALNAQNIDRHPDGAWTARQVIHHVADSEVQSYVRLRRLIAEPAGSLIQGYDEGAWAECDALGYRELPVEHSLAVIACVRRASFDVLHRLGESDLTRHGVHTDAGPYTLAYWLATYREHPRAHAAQLVEAISA